MDDERYPVGQPPEHLDERPGVQAKMRLKPKTRNPEYKGSGKLNGKVALVTGGDSGIGQAVAVAFAREGADIVVSYLKEHVDAEKTRQLVEAEDRRCLAIAGDIGSEKICKQLVEQTIQNFGRLHILVNNAAEQHPQSNIEDITSEQLEKTFRTNIFSMFFMTKAASPHLKESSCVINTASVTAYKGNPQLLDYSSTKGAIVAFTYSLSQAWAERGVRVNAVAPGPIWTPLIPSTFPPEHVERFGTNVPLGRAGQPEEVAPAYVFLASGDSSYVTGQVIHVNGGTVANA